MRKLVGVFIGISLLLTALSAAAQTDGTRVCITAYHDANRNGIREAMEPALANVLVYIQDAQNVVLNSYATTGAEPYCFSGVPAGTYMVMFSGAVTPTGPEGFSINIQQGQSLPVSLDYGAIPIEADAQPVQQPAATSSNSSSSGDVDILQWIFALGGAATIMVLFAMLGVIIYWVRFRGQPASSRQQRPQTGQFIPPVQPQYAPQDTSSTEQIPAPDDAPPATDA